MSSNNGWGFPGQLAVGSGGSVQAQAKGMDHPSQTTVSASLDLSALAATTTLKAALAVDFVVGTGVTSRVCDLASAASISGVASSVLARVIDESPTRTGEQVPVMLTMSRYPRPSSSVTPVRTGFTGAVGPSGSITVAVPPGASGVMVLGSSFAALTIEQVGGGDVTHAPPVIASSDVVIGQAQPLLAGARSIVVYNPGTGSTTATVVFVIDG